MKAQPTTTEQREIIRSIYVNEYMFGGKRLDEISKSTGFTLAQIHSAMNSITIGEVMKYKKMKLNETAN